MLTSELTDEIERTKRLKTYDRNVEDNLVDEERVATKMKRDEHFRDEVLVRVNATICAICRDPEVVHACKLCGLVYCADCGDRKIGRGCACLNPKARSCSDDQRTLFNMESPYFLRLSSYFD